MDELRDKLQGALGTAYTIEDELGGGGMSRIFVATETSLGRRVVVKVLSPDLAIGVSGTRFSREIRVAAGLQQANIVPVLSSGEIDGLPYFTMPFVHGLSLRERLSEGRLPIAEAASILRDVARALAFAHERGIVHRDVKPENVLLSGDTAVVTDFGIAKAVSASRQPTSSGTLTQAGTTIGTPAYMSPEQAVADPAIDHRSDIYSFGCLGYELLTGTPPFLAHDVSALIAAHLTQAPRPILQLRPDCPAALSALVMRCLEKDPRNRPQTARDLIHGLDGAATPATLPVSRMPRTRMLWAIAGVATLALVVLATLSFRRRHEVVAETASLAVLPFLNVGSDSTEEYLATGMSDELTTALGKVPGVAVVARTMAARYRGRAEVDAREAGRTLGVAYILQGSVRRSGDKLRVSAQLASATDGREVWAETYDRVASDVFSVQDDITRAILVALKQRLAPRDVRSAAQSTQGTADPVAYDFYLRGQYLLERRGVVQSIDRFNSAIARDSSFGRAYAGLAEALEYTPYFGGRSAPEIQQQVRTLALRALAIDSTLARAHVALALAHMHAWEWREAEAEFQHAIALDPSDAASLTQYGRFLVHASRPADARARLTEAKRLDPSSSITAAWLGQALAAEGLRTEALSELNRALDIDSMSGASLVVASLIHLDAGRTAEARRLASRMMTMRYGFSAVGSFVLGATGDSARVVTLAHQIEGMHPRPWFGEYNIAGAYLGAGDTARALAALERSTDAREIWPSFAPLSSRMYDSLRGSPRFAALVKRVGLDVPALTRPRAGRPPA